MDKGVEEDIQYTGQGPGAGRDRGSQGLNNVLNSISNFIRLKQFQDALEECDRALAKYSYNEELLERKIKILRHQGRFEDAYTQALQWLQREPRHPMAIKELKRLKIVLDALKDQDSDDSEKTDPLEPAFVQQPSLPQTNITPHRKPNREAPVLDLSCSFCNVKFDTKNDLDNHCRSDEHKKNITSDEGHSWKYRPPPRGLAAEDYTLCNNFVENIRCPFADKCTEAHSHEELEEWRERFKFKRQQLQMAKDKRLHGNTYPEQLMEKLLTAEYRKSVMVADVDYAKVIVNSDLKVNIISKKCTHAWTFTITSKLCILRVVLLDEASSNYFYISSISVGPKKTQKYQNLETHCQEWKNPDITINKPGEYVYRVKVVFRTDIYGTFRQTLVFDFGSEPVLSREMHIESAPVTDTEKVLSEIRLSQQGRWRSDQVHVVHYKLQSTPEDARSHELISKYSLPEMDKFRFSDHLMHLPSKENYRLWMHQMLYVEEMSMIEKISKFNITTSLQLVNRFLLMPGSLSAAKFAEDGELFARMKLEDDLSVDSVAGRLILKSTNLVWLAPHDSGSKPQDLPKKVYEAVIEDRGKNFIYLRLSKECVDELQLDCDQEFFVEVQFQLNRLHLCEMHFAVDALRTLDIVFPESDSLNKLPDVDWKWKEDVGQKTNENQRDAIQKVAAYSHIPTPPLLIVGPFGTGKTYTLAQCAKHVLKEPDTRILLCTQSNSAADIYIKEFFHPYVMEGNTEARPLRVLYRHRWIQTVSDTVLQYCIQEMEGPQAGSFRKPEIEDVEKHRIIITTLSAARLLSDIVLPEGFFTHIFLDEAAQALECEMLIPLALAGPKTRVVLAGDHMQMSPEAFSDIGRQQQFHKSLLERMYDLYPDTSPSKVMLCENYRSNRAIIEFTSELFYEDKLKASKDPIAHSVYYPLTFFTARGEEVQHENSSGYYNTAEIYEVIEQVEHLQKHWPSNWGELDDSGICVVAPYSDQVIRIRAELRKRKMVRIAVERVVNVQGKQFRVMIMSTVRTRHTCPTDAATTDKLDLGFLSNIKLLNTAITRAQSLVIAIGDPVSLCLVGKCSKVWEYYLEVCNDNGSFFGMTEPHWRSLLNNAEMTKTYILNPLAPEFIPKGANVTQPVFISPPQPGQHAVPHMWPHGYRGQPHPQMFYPNPYMPMMYPNPYPMYHPHYGPIMYRPPIGVYPTVPGRGSPQGALRKQQGHKQKAAQAQNLPLQRDDEDISPSASPKLEQTETNKETPTKEASKGADKAGQDTTQSGKSLLGTPTAGLAGSKKAGQKRWVPVNLVPRLPMYPPYYAYPHYYLPPDDPQLHGVPAGVPPGVPAGIQPPYFYQYPNLPRQPVPLMMPHMVQVQTRPGSGSVSPASSSDGSASRLATSPQGGGRDAGETGPPQSLSPNSAQAHYIQVLPNVKHVPSHLLYNPPGSGNNSRSSTPVQVSSPGPQHGPQHATPAASTSVKQKEQQTNMAQQKQPTLAQKQASLAQQKQPTIGQQKQTNLAQQKQPVAARVKQSPPPNFSPDVEAMSRRKRQHSGPRPVSQSPSFSSQSSHESSTSPVLNGDQPSFKVDSKVKVETTATTVEKKIGASSRTPRPLKLNTNTGFSRQFSDELGTPVEITNIVRMIDENIEESDEELHISRPDEILPRRDLNEFHQQQYKPSAPAGKLFLKLQQPNQSDINQTSSGSSIEDDGRPHFSMMGRHSFPVQRDVDYDPLFLEPQTPMTPAGFHTPGTDIDLDPLEVLKNLTITNDNLNRSAHGHF